MELRDAISKAVDHCIGHGVLAEYLRDKKVKVREMFLSTYDEATTFRRLREEAMREGYDEGYDDGYVEGYADGYVEGYVERRRSILEHARDKVNDGSMSVQDALDLGFSEAELCSETKA